MIFGIMIADWFIALGLVSVVFWLYFFVVYTFNIRKETDFGLYFRAMFKSYGNSELRIGWSSIIFSLEYGMGILITGFIKSAWYPAQWFRALVGFILFGQKRKDRIERDTLADKPKRKKKDNGGVY